MRIPGAAAVAPCHSPTGAKGVNELQEEDLDCRSADAGKPGPYTWLYLIPTHSHRGSCPASPGRRRSRGTLRASAWTAGPAAIAATGVAVTAWPGTPVTVTVTPRPLAHAISQGQPVAQATVTIGSEVRHITLDASQAAPAPSIRWLLTRL